MLKYLILVLGLSTQVFADGGDRAGNGGNDLGAEFVARGKFAAYQLNKYGTNLNLTSAKIERFKAAVKETRSPERTTDKLYDDFTGELVAAKTVDDPANPGKKKIIYNEDDFRLALKEGRANRIAAHEYCRVSEIEDNRYEVSSSEYLSEIAFVDWSRKILSELDSNPKIDSITDMIYGNFEIGIAGVGGEDANAKALAIESYNKACEKWKADAKALLGQRALRVSCGGRTDDHEQSEARVLGQFSFSTGTISLSESTAVRIFKEDITGDSFSCGRDCRYASAETVATARKKAGDSFNKKCSDWKDELKQTLGSKLLYATCEAYYGNGRRNMLTTVTGFQYTSPGVYYLVP